MSNTVRLHSNEMAYLRGGTDSEIDWKNLENSLEIVWDRRSNLDFFKDRLESEIDWKVRTPSLCALQSERFINFCTMK